MTLWTRWFGTRVEGEALKGLLRALGKPETVLYTLEDRWTTADVYGKCSIRPVNSGLDVDLYVYRTDAHIIDGSIEFDKFVQRGEVPSPKNGRATSLSTKHYSGLIPYPKA